MIQMLSQGKSGESTRFVPARFKEEPLFYKEEKEEIYDGRRNVGVSTHHDLLC